MGKCSHGVKISILSKNVHHTFVLSTVNITIYAASLMNRQAKSFLKQTVFLSEK